ncbi:hypothetical protein OG21DRAFT_1488798 [Imleria badia]|nr:hypothetical protein OG21DRAFT_1488798 [Imleria badia]
MFIHADMQHLQKDTYVAFIGPSANLHPSLSKDLWDQLNTFYSPAGIIGQFEAFSEALCIQIQDLNEGHCRGPTSDVHTMASQINKLTSTYDKMTSAGLTLPENLKAMILLNSLPSSYRSLVSTIVQTTTAAQFTLDNVIPKVVSEGQLRHTSQSNRLPPYSMPPPSLLALIVAKVTLVTVAGKSMAVPDSPISNHDNSQVVVANLIDPTLALEGRARANAWKEGDAFANIVMNNDYSMDPDINYYDHPEIDMYDEPAIYMDAPMLTNYESFPAIIQRIIRAY